MKSTGDQPSYYPDNLRWDLFLPTVLPFLVTKTKLRNSEKTILQKKNTCPNLDLEVLVLIIGTLHQYDYKYPEAERTPVDQAAPPIY